MAVNLVFYMLSSWLVSLAVLNLQRRGHVRVRERFFGLGCWAVAVGILGCGTLADGRPLLSDTPAMRTAEYGAAIVFALMQTYHTWLHWHEFSNIRHALNQYYDGEEDELTRQAIDRWTAGEHYCRQRLNIQEVATEMGIARELLSAWLSRRHIDYAGWLNRLRIEKAKELLTAHPEWSNEAVARECGFTDRSYFQRKFKELTGRTPAEWRA